MTARKSIQLEQQRLIDGNAFDHDLYGYAASAAAAELIDHWRDCGTEITTLQQRTDVDDVIAALQQWKQTHVCADKYRAT